MRALLGTASLAFGALLLAVSLAAAEAPGSISASVLPGDVLAEAGKIPPGLRKLYCNGAGADSLKSMAPVTEIKGFTSRMLDVYPTLPNVRKAEDFVASFGASAIRALVSDDDAAKRTLIAVLAKWADAGAFLKSASCMKAGGNLDTKGKCGEWRKPDGSDLSSMKDATFSTFLAVGLVRTYYVALADAAPDMKAEHAAIQQWIGKVALRVKRTDDSYGPEKDVRWYWAGITYAMAKGDSAEANRILASIQRAFIAAINKDGSITDRTTRGDRSLWYHFSGIGQLVTSMEMMRAAGLPIDPVLETKLHGAVDLFVAAIKDESILDKWAKKRVRSKYNGKQEWEWDQWTDENSDGGWFHIYPYRYPDREASKELRRLVPATAQSATEDLDFGLGIGCVYNAAQKARDLPTAQ